MDEGIPIGMIPLRLAFTDEGSPGLEPQLKGSTIKTITHPHGLLHKQLDTALVVIMVGVIDGRSLFQPFKHDVLLGLSQLGTAPIGLLGFDDCKVNNL